MYNIQNGNKIKMQLSHHLFIFMQDNNQQLPDYKLTFLSEMD